MTRRRSEYCRIIHETKEPSRGDYSTIFTEPQKKNNYNCFSIITHKTGDYQNNCILLVSSSETSRNRTVAILKISASVL